MEKYKEILKLYHQYWDASDDQLYFILTNEKIEYQVFMESVQYAVNNGILDSSVVKISLNQRGQIDGFITTAYPFTHYGEEWINPKPLLPRQVEVLPKKTGDAFIEGYWSGLGEKAAALTWFLAGSLFTVLMYLIFI